MNCPACGGAMPEVTIGTGDDALTMGSCDRCSKRYWHQHGEIIDLREALGAIGDRVPTPRRQPAPPSGSSPVGTTSAVELLRAGLAGRHVIAALKRELGLDDRQALAALTAAEWSQLTLT
jgi:hypothetical protein